MTEMTLTEYLNQTEPEPPNLIKVGSSFEPYFFEHLYQIIRRQGVESTRQTLLLQKMHPAFVNAAIKRVQRKWGW
jgi:hypothetical protein